MSRATFETKMAPEFGEGFARRWFETDGYVMRPGDVWVEVNHETVLEIHKSPR